MTSADKHSESILGVRVDDLSLSDFLNYIEDTINEDHKSTISYVNIHAMNLAFTIPWFRKFLLDSDIVFCDGFGVKLGMWLNNKRIRYRYTPPDFIEDICQRACRNEYHLFFLGARDGVAEKAASRLREKFPGLKIRTQHGYFQKEKDSPENQKTIEEINAFRTNLLFLGMGMPLQEQWICENLELLKINIAFPAGALFDYISGEQIRAPRWMTDHGLEWIGRLLIEPRRLWRRYIMGNPIFFWRVFVHEILKRKLPK